MSGGDDGVGEARDLRVRLERTVTMVRLLQRATTAANAATSLSAAVGDVLEDVCSETGWPIGHLYLVSTDGTLVPTRVWRMDDPERFKAFRAVTETMTFARGEGVPGRVLASGGPVWVTDATDKSSYPRLATAARLGVRSAFAFPILTKAEVVGVLEFFSPDDLAPDAELLDVLCNIGGQLGRVVERMRAEDALRASEARARKIVETARDSFIAIDEDSSVVEWNSQAEATFGWSRDEALGRDLAELIVPPAFREAHRVGVTHFLRTGEGPVLGQQVELTAIRRDGTELEVELTPWAVRDEGGSGYRFNAFVRDITERKAFERRLEHQALHDALTGLPNRALLLERLRLAFERAGRNASLTGVLFIDLDRFKAVNDSLGHEAGDELLVEVTARVQRAVRAEDLLARHGGDELVVLCEDLHSVEAAGDVADRVLQAMAAPFDLSRGQVYVGASIGIATARGLADAERVLGDADLAMYRAKAEGRSTSVIFDDAMRLQILDRVDTERELRRAISRRVLDVHFQPIVSLATGSVTGAEALVRWNDDQRGPVPTAFFVGLAEDVGLAGSIFEHVLGETCAVAAEDDLAYSVNVSVRQLEHAGLYDELCASLKACGVDPARLVLEVTESVLMHDLPTVVRRLWGIRELGVAMALDDFGTAYSSLDRLRRMPVDTLKIDQSFVAEIETSPGGRTLVAAMVAMAHSLGLGVVAEGVEEVEQLVALARLGCDDVQGYFLARPTPREGLREAIHAAEVVCQSTLEGRTAVPAVNDELLAAVTRAMADEGDLQRRTRSLLAELERIVSRQ